MRETVFHPRMNLILGGSLWREGEGEGGKGEGGGGRERGGAKVESTNCRLVSITSSRTRLTTTSEPQWKGEEVESAPWLTTITVPTTTTVYTTHAPPPSGVV